MKLKDLNFTPGPWKADEESVYLRNDASSMICTIRGWGLFLPMKGPSAFLHKLNTEEQALEIQKANGKLISKAPEMLEKLKKAEEALNELFNLIDSGVLVRDISKDHLPDYTINALKLTLKLKDALTTKTEITDLLNS